MSANFRQFLRKVDIRQSATEKVTARKIYILPTRYGLLYAILVIALLAGSINYANNPGYMLTFFMASIGVMSILHTWRNLLGLELGLLPSNAVFCKQDAIFSVQVSNPTSQHKFSISVQVDGFEPVFNNLEPETSRIFEVRAQTTKRGRFYPDRFILSTTYPFGLLRAWIFIESDHHVLVYPEAIELIKPEAHIDYDSSMQGDKGIGADDFVSHRSYKPGDSPRHIDWKVFAREAGLMTKQFGGDRRERIWLSLDLLAGKPLELQLSGLTAAVLLAEKNHLEYGLKLPGKTLAISQGTAHATHCLENLALFGEKP